MTRPAIASPAAPGGSLHEEFRRGIAFLRERQAADGSFATRAGPPLDLDTRGIDDPSIYTTVMVATALQAVRHDAASDILARALTAIDAQRLPGGVWRFWTRDHAGADFIPPDLDDTVCCLRLLRRARGAIAIPDRLIVENRAGDGRFFTWILPRLRHAAEPRAWGILARVVRRPLKLRRWLLSGIERPSWHDVDVVVNINVVSLVGDRAEVEAAKAWIRDVVTSGREARSDRWYQSAAATWYALLLCSEFDVSCFDDLRPLVCTRLEALREPGQCERLTLLESAMCATVASAWAPASPVIPHLLERVLAEQRTDGSWPACPVYYGGYRRARAWGSRELSTALCVEALFRSARAAGESWAS